MLQHKKLIVMGAAALLAIGTESRADRAWPGPPGGEPRPFQCPDAGERVAVTAPKERKGVNAPFPAEGLIEIEGEQATLLVPVDLGEARLDANVGPIDLHSVRTEITGRGVGLTLFASNTSPRDREVTLEAVLLDGSGRPIGRRTRRRDVEEGECGERLGVQWILSGDQLATARTVRVVVSSRLD